MLLHSVVTEKGLSQMPVGCMQYTYHSKYLHYKSITRCRQRTSKNDCRAFVRFCTYCISTAKVTNKMGINLITDQYLFIFQDLLCQ